MISFCVYLKTIGLTSVGWSLPSALGVDIPFARRGRVTEGNSITYEIYIPGSSFKGALRSAASRVADAYGFKNCKEIKPEAIEHAHMFQGICEVCELFGYPKNNAPSSLMISDLEPTKPIDKLEITRVRIDDYSLKAAKGALFKSECVVPKTVFKGSLTVSDVNQRLLGLLLLSMAELRMDRFGRSSFVDLKIEDTEALEEKLSGTHWLTLVSDLKEFLWK
ncbi:MAG: RAMP superfamily CRISPR-associated protein [Thermoproteota archaeon]